MVIGAVVSSGTLISMAAAPPVDITNKQQLMEALLQRDKDQDIAPNIITVRDGVIGGFMMLDDVIDGGTSTGTSIATTGAAITTTGAAITFITEEAATSYTYKRMTQELKDLLKGLFEEYATQNLPRRTNVSEAFSQIRIGNDINTFYNAYDKSGFSNLIKQINVASVDNENNSDGIKIMLSMLVFSAKKNGGPIIEELSNGNVIVQINPNDNLKWAMDRYFKTFYNNILGTEVKLDTILAILGNKINTADSTERANFIAFLKAAKVPLNQEIIKAYVAPKAGIVTNSFSGPSSGPNSFPSSGGTGNSSNIIEEDMKLPQSIDDILKAAKAILEAPSTDATLASNTIKALREALVGEIDTLTPVQVELLKDIIDLAYDKVRSFHATANLNENDGMLAQSMQYLDALEADAGSMGISMNFQKVIKIIGQEVGVQISLSSYEKLLGKDIPLEFAFGDIGFIMPVGKLGIPGNTTKLLFSAKMLMGEEALPYNDLVDSNKKASFFQLHVGGDAGAITFIEGQKIAVKFDKAFANEDEANEFALFFVNESGDKATQLVKPQSYDALAGSFEFGLEHFSTYELLQTKVNFQDIGRHTWAQSAIKNLVAKEIIVGMSPLIFAPNAPVTRAQFATMLVKSFGLTDENSKISFEDVDKKAWYYSVVSAAYHKGIIKGRSLVRFDPDAAITRAEMTVMMNNVIKAYKLKAESKVAPTGYQDQNTVPEFAKESVDLVTRIGLMSGHPGKIFSPNLLATRAEAAVVIYKLFSVE